MCIWIVILVSVIGVFGQPDYPGRYLVIGDWGSMSNGGSYAKTQSAVAAAMSVVAANYSTQFVISVGDNFYQTGVSSPTDPKFNTDFKDVYTQASLQTPWVISLGNHDYQGIVKAQLDFKGDKRWYLPSRNYTVHVDLGSSSTGMTMIFLDTSPFISEYYVHPENPQMKIELASQHWEEQVQWLTSTLKATRQKYGKDHWITVYGHHTIYSSLNSHAIQENDMQARVDPLLMQFNVTAYICGHAHNLQHIQANGIDYFVSGAGSRVDLPPLSVARKPKLGLVTKYAAVKPGFMLVQLSDTEMLFTFYDNNSKELYSSRRTK